MHRIRAILVAAAALASAISPALADNAMGYRLLPPQEAASLPQNHGSLGLTLERAQQITDANMTFDILKVTQVRSGSPGAAAGFRPGDQIISVDGRVFPSLKVFAAYVGAMRPGQQAMVDYIPVGGGPAQAQRVSVTVGGAPGMSTGTKVAIGVGAAALLGCYELGCFSHRNAAPQQGQPQ